MYIGQKLSFGIDSGEIRFENGVFPPLKINCDTCAHGEINSSSVRSDVIHRREWARGANLANSVKRTFADCELFIVVHIIA